MVDVKDIQAGEIMQNLSESMIESLADAILTTGGLVKPLILKRVGLENYQLIDGHLEYYAALRAKAKDLRKGEMVNAFVVSPDEEDLVKQQVKVLQSAHSPTNHIETATNTLANTSPQSEQSEHLSSNSKNLSVTDYTHFQSQLDAKLDAKFSNYHQVIQNQLRQNQQDLQLALQKIQYAWETTLNNQLRQQREEIQAQLRSHSPSTPPVATPSKISDPLLEVREKPAVTKNGLSARININEVKTSQELTKEKIPQLAAGRATAILKYRKQLGGKISSLDQLTEAGSGINEKMIRQWSAYLTC